MEETYKVSDKVTPKPFWKEKSNLFVINIVLIYVGWKIAFFLLHTGNGPVQREWAAFVFWVGSIYANITSGLLNALGQQTIHNGIDVVFTKIGKTILIQEHCLAMPAMVLFTACILLFTGSWRNKIWFVPLGLLFIIGINIVRLILVCLTFVNMSIKTFHLYHSIIYVAITYTLILLMIYWWMKKFATAGSSPATPPS